MTDSSAIRLLCVDDNPDLSFLLHKQIGLQDDMESVGLAHDLDDVLDAVTRTQPDVVVMDFSMLGRDALTTMVEIQTAYPQIRTLIYSGYDDAETIDRARQAGAWGYAVKCRDIEDLFQAIRRVAGGERVFPPN